jgi:predicted lipoprotein with Yx(FWY)xxD motif
MVVRPTSWTAVGARGSARVLRLRSDGVGRRKAPLRWLAATLALTAGVALVPLLAGAASGASAASTGVTISTAPGPFGTMIVVGSGKYAGYSLYLMTSDQLPHFGCTTAVLKLGPGVSLSCTGPSNDQNAEWPALTTTGSPVAGPGVTQTLLGTVKRPGIGTQVTYAGHPLYLFDTSAGPVSGEGWFEPGLPPFHGVWYAVSAQGLPLPWAGTLTEAPIAGRTVLSAQMIDGGAVHDFPVYSLSGDAASKSACNGSCATTWPPLLTAGTPGLTEPLRTSSLGTLKRTDGTLQVTYHGKPLYLYSLEGIVRKSPAGGGHAAGNGNGLKSPGGGTFTLVTP